MKIKHDRVQVLKIGLGLICNQGYTNLGVDEICKVTGMTKGAFYNAFKSKENFLIDAIKMYSKITLKRLQIQLSKENNKPLAIDRLIDLYDFMFEAQPKNNFMGCMVNNIMSELGSNNLIIAKIATDEFNQFIKIIEPCVKDAQENGDLIKTFDSITIAELLHSTFYGALTVCKSSKNYLKGKQMMHILINNLKTTK
jgi:TetR/AcrR family transcriptional repressor of nem operon